MTDWFGKNVANVLGLIGGGLHANIEPGQGELARAQHRGVVQVAGPGQRRGSRLAARAAHAAIRPVPPAAVPQDRSAGTTAAADLSFNAITIDGDTSTNDSFIVMASGASQVEIPASGQAHDIFRQALIEVCQK